MTVTPIAEPAGPLPARQPLPDSASLAIRERELPEATAKERPAAVLEERALVLAPHGRDAALARTLLGEVGIEATICPDLGALVQELEHGAGLAVIAEEALATDNLRPLSAWIAAQPPWSDFPFVLLTGHSGGLERNPAAGRLMEILGNVAFLERPCHAMTLLGAVRGALRARRRQYQARAYAMERAEAAEQLRVAKEAAERANAAKSRFLATASHDLRQPLQSLLLFVDALKPHVQGTVGQTQLMHLGRGLDAMKALLDSLLDISRLDAGAVAPARQDFPIQHLIDSLATAYTPIAAVKGLTLRVSPCDAIVRSDPTLLGRMLRNLVENAVHYTEAGEIALECRCDKGALQILVRDTGVGIPSEHLERIWEEFHQVGNSERDRNQGLGLGLAIVRRLSGLLGHAVEVCSTPSEGSTFSITVPLGTAAPVRPGVDAPAANGTGRFAVVVDDDAIVLMGLQSILQTWGYDVLVAGSTDQVLERLRTDGRRPDIVIADYRLREHRFGTEGIVEIRRRLGAEIPGILLTGETGPECAREAAALKVAMVHKPVTPRQLGDIIERQMKGA